jgi:hypothetical protein
MKKLKYILITERNALGEIRYSASFVTPWYKRNEEIQLKHDKNLWYVPYWVTNREQAIRGIEAHAKSIRGDAYEIVVKEPVEA